MCYFTHGFYTCSVIIISKNNNLKADSYEMGHPGTKCYQVRLLHIVSTVDASSCCALNSAFYHAAAAFMCKKQILAHASSV